MPAEWEQHAATWIAWPRREGISYPGLEEEAQRIWLSLAEVISRYEPVHINVFHMGYYQFVARELRRRGLLTAARCQIHLVPAYEPWIRDHGPLFVFPTAGAATPTVLDWRFNAWGGKYPPWDLDDLVPGRVARLLSLPSVSLPFVLEGGAIETNGAGLLLASATCLLNPNRNGAQARPALEAALRRFLGAAQVVWLEGELDGDDTDGHLDQHVRFIDERTVLFASVEDWSDPNWRSLARLRVQIEEKLRAPGLIDAAIPMRLPPRRVFRGQPLPMSYLNFYFVNGALIVPVYGEATDDHAVGLLRDLLPNRDIVPFPARDMIWGLGAVHCATQQQPAMSENRC